MADLELNILSKREELNNENTSICYMCEGKLEDYVKSIPPRYTDYDVQRGIVANVYLDRLAKTILENKFIPPIVLIATNPDIGDADECNNENIIIDEYRILDGLQRTYRIKAIYAALQFYIQEVENKVDFSSITKFKLSKTYKTKLEELDTNATTLWTISTLVNEKNYQLDYLKNVFSNFVQWFEVWSDLEKKEQIDKMLVLNAGHKPMDIKHQLELLFLNVMPDEYLKIFERSKDINSSFFYKNKQKGQLHLSHFISALLSFDQMKPITVDAKYIQKLQDNLDQELEKIKFYFEEDNLEKLIDFTKALDSIFSEYYADDNIGLQWLGRETVLIGLFSAFGRYYYEKKQNCNFEQCLEEIIKTITKHIAIFNIGEFNKAKTTSIDITKVNIGNVFKFTTFNAMCMLLLKNKIQIDWDKLFKYGTKALDDCQ